MYGIDQEILHSIFFIILTITFLGIKHLKVSGSFLQRFSAFQRIFPDVIMDHLTEDSLQIGNNTKMAQENPLECREWLQKTVPLIPRCFMQLGPAPFKIQVPYIKHILSFIKSLIVLLPCWHLSITSVQCTLVMDSSWSPLGSKKNTEKSLRLQSCSLLLHQHSKSPHWCTVGLFLVTLDC